MDRRIIGAIVGIMGLGSIDYLVGAVIEARIVKEAVDIVEEVARIIEKVAADIVGEVAVDIVMEVAVGT